MGMISQADDSGDGQISYQEFIQYQTTVLRLPLQKLTSDQLIQAYVLELVRTEVNGIASPDVDVEVEVECEVEVEVEVEVECEVEVEVEVEMDFPEIEVEIEVEVEEC